MGLLRDDLPRNFGYGWTAPSNFMKSTYSHSEGSQSEVEKSLVVELKTLSERTGMPIKQESGQRLYGPPSNWNGPPPPKGNNSGCGFEKLSPGKEHKYI